MDTFGLSPTSYSIAIQLFVRLLGLIYVFAYFPFLFQIQGLLGKDGILPINSYLNFLYARLGKRSYYYCPTLLWFNASDRALWILIVTGLGLGILLTLGWHSPVILLSLYVIHLSLTSAGQDFLSFGWETFLMEITLSAFLIIATTPYNIFGWISLNFLLFRFYIQAGASKWLSGDQTWRHLTAIGYHYLTQPLPNTIAWFAHKLPKRFHQLTTFIMFYIELVVPLAIFTPPGVRFWVFWQMVGLQWGIWLTGNLSYLNHMTAACCIILLNNQFLGDFLEPIPLGTPSSKLWEIVISVLALGFLCLQGFSVWQTFFPNRFCHKILKSVYPLHLAYPHHIFSMMTIKRYEIIIEGSLDGKYWQAYEFFYKPGDLFKRPRRISPYQPRLDWQAWFLPFAPFEEQHWFQAFLIKLLQGSQSVLRLLKHNPFPEQPPTWIRVQLYDYEFTSFREKKLTGTWWKRRYVGEYTPPLNRSVP